MQYSIKFEQTHDPIFDGTEAKKNKQFRVPAGYLVFSFLSQRGIVRFSPLGLPATMLERSKGFEASALQSYHPHGGAGVFSSPAERGIPVSWLVFPYRCDTSDIHSLIFYPNLTGLYKHTDFVISRPLVCSSRFTSSLLPFSSLQVRPATAQDH